MTKHLWYWLHVVTYHLAVWCARRYARSVVPEACVGLTTHLSWPRGSVR